MRMRFPAIAFARPPTRLSTPIMTRFIHLPTYLSTIRTTYILTTLSFFGLLYFGREGLYVFFVVFGSALVFWFVGMAWSLLATLHIKKARLGE